MKTNPLIAVLLAALAIAVFQLVLKENLSMAADSAPQKMLAHNVYFALNESTPANRDKLIAACKKYLADHPGVVFFAAGTVSDLDREVNDRDWDVGLHVIFKDRASHDAYQTAPKHLEFIKENKATWKKVRVFDTDAEGAK